MCLFPLLKYMYVVYFIILVNNFQINCEKLTDGIQIYNQTCGRKSSKCDDVIGQSGSVDKSVDDNNVTPVGWIARPFTELLFGFAPSGNSKKLSKSCAKHVELYRQHLLNNTLWATQMLDSSALTPSGILSGDNYQLGHFDQCLDIYVRFHDNDNITGQYCLSKVTVNPSPSAMPEFYRDSFVKHPKPLEYDPLASSWTTMKVTKDPTRQQRNTLYWAICLPSSCTPKEIERSLNELVVPVLAEKGIDASISLDGNLCHTRTPNIYTTQSSILILIMTTFFVLVVICSIYDIFFYKRDIARIVKNSNKGKLESLMLSFSVYENFVNLKRLENSDDLLVIHGMRSYTTILVMLGHRFMFTCGSPMSNPELMEQRTRNFDATLILNGFLIVDTFFVLSGFLTCYLIMLELKRSNRFDLLLIYFHRLLRIIPLYYLVIGLNALILPLLGDGPLWPLKAGSEAKRCQNSWWENALFINNYTQPELCMFQSWFLACDMHFFIFGPILAYIFHKKPRCGVIIALTLLFISILIPFSIIYFGNLDGVLKISMSVVENPMANDYFKNVYMRSHNRAGPYVVGVLTAYLLHHLKRINFKFTYGQVLIGSILWFSIALGILLLAWIFYIPERAYSAIENALYGSLHRIVWSSAISWIILTGGTTTFGIVSPVLTLKALVPLSRLTYAVFLIHGFIQQYTVAIIRVPEYIRVSKLLWMWTGDVFSSFVFGLVLHLFYEAPVSGLTRILLQGIIKKRISKDGSNEAKKGKNEMLKTVLKTKKSSRTTDQKTVLSVQFQDVMSMANNASLSVPDVEKKRL